MLVIFTGVFINDLEQNKIKNETRYGHGKKSCHKACTQFPPDVI
ncbi:hypothetical protein NIES4071_74700 [Calothrix sp. NIES-4071]|nr:hypothetical protein NIES4071_74700 [Calothrix sp. NIES-4071]BAZ61745.1 hypothetical protein NIES4105_74650 [Calothrix sp. NIES-4105]